MPPAARVTDMHTCPMVTPGVPPIPHVGGPILPPGAVTVLIGFLPAARVTDMCVCVGPPDAIAMGSPTVMIDYLMAARLGDPTVHGGVIVLGEPTVMIGESGGGGAGGPGAGGGAAGAASATCGLSQSQTDTPITENTSEYSSGSGTFTDNNSPDALVPAMTAGGQNAAANPPSGDSSGHDDPSPFVPDMTSSGQNAAASQADPPAPSNEMPPENAQKITDQCAANGITDPDIQKSYVAGSDPKKPVTKEKLPPKTKFDMWVRDNGKPGLFCAPPGTDPATLGIDTKGRHLEQYEVNEGQELNVVKSTAADFETGKIAGVGGKGGGTQYMLPPNWQNSVTKQ